MQIFMPVIIASCSDRKQFLRQMIRTSANHVAKISIFICFIEKKNLSLQQITSNNIQYD